MSTYLVSWAVLPDDFDSIEIKTDKNVQVLNFWIKLKNLINWHFYLKIKVHARKSITQKKGADFALEVAKKSMDFFDTYFDNDSPVPPKIGKLN